MRQSVGMIQQVISAGSPWWGNPRGWSGRDHDLREAQTAPYDHTAGVLSGLVAGGLYVLRGPRRVGKSVEVKKSIETLIADGVEPRSIIHVSVDGWRAKDLFRLVNSARALVPEVERRYWFIDEITSIPDGWPHQVKWLRDNDSWFRGDTVVLTGSSSSNLTQAIGALAGRRGPAVDSDRLLLPMGFRTFVRLTTEDGPPAEVGALRLGELTSEQVGEAALALVPWLYTLVNAWEAYLRVGGFHQAVTSHIKYRDMDEVFQKALFEVVDRDALRRSLWSRTETAAFLRRVAKGLSSQTNRAAVAEELDVDPSTVTHRITDLREAFVLWLCYREKQLPGERVLVPRTRSQQKLYFTDPVYSRLTPGLPPDLSVRSEQQLGMALWRNIETSRPGSFLDLGRVMHHRSSTRAEIDFVGPDLGDLAIESKYVDGRWRRAARTLEASRWRGIVATRSVLDLDTPDLLAVPVSMLTWLIDT